MKRTECVRTRRRLALRMALLILAALVLVFLLLEKNLEKVILDMAHARAEAMAVEYINEAVRAVPFPMRT